ncbi:acyl-CoA dehydrogenase family protein [Nocardia takedensis]
MPATQQTAPASLVSAETHAYLAEIAQGAAARERDRELPHKEIRRLADLRVGALRVPVEHGGPGATIEQTMEFVIALSAADANIAQAVRPHFGTVEGIISGRSAREADRWYPRVLAGDLFGLAHTEIGAGEAEIRTRYVRDGDDYRIDGAKYYSTGCLFADLLRVSAVGDDGEIRWFIIPRDREGVELLDDWDGAGQRLTASGTTRLVRVRATAADLVERQAPSGERSHVLTFQQLFLAAIQIGIAKNVLTDARWFVGHRARPIAHAHATRSADDPYVRHTVGEIAARAYSAEAGVLRAAATLDRAVRDTDQDARVAAVVEVAQAQFVAVEAALKTAELLYEVGGASVTARTHNYDRHWRNARTIANHNPRAHKASVIGDYLLNGAEPPTSGSF